MSGFPITYMAPPQTCAISLRNVTPSILENPIEFEELKQDLIQMRCAGLLEEGAKEGGVGSGDGATRAPQYLPRDRSQLWIADLWRDTYSFPRGGSGLSNWMEGYHEGQFIHQVDAKDGYSVGDC